MNDPNPNNAPDTAADTVRAPDASTATPAPQAGPAGTTHFGFRDVPTGDKQKLVGEVFSSVAGSYSVDPNGAVCAPPSPRGQPRSVRPR